MQHELLKLMAEKLSYGLRRKSIDTCSKWALNHRMMGKPFPGKWTFKYHPWLKDMHDTQASFNVGQKSAQMGYTETALNVAFYYIDIKAVDVLYVLPAKTPDASDFSASRFDAALELSTHLSNLFSDVKNVGHKRAGAANLYIRGSKSRGGLKSIPTGLIILDEVDEMPEENIRLALERSAGQVEKLNWAFSTPTLPGVGINKLYNETTKEHFFFSCPSCSRRTELIFPESLVVCGDNFFDARIKESHLICKECKAKLEHRTKFEWLQSGVWVSQHDNRDKRGFYVNQLYSSTVSPVELAEKYFQSLMNPADEQEFHNSNLGKEHVVSGAQILDSDIEACIGGYKTGATRSTSRIVTMGVDVGKVLHYEIDEWILGNSIGKDINTDAKCRVIDFGTVKEFEQLDDLIMEHGITFIIVDANPERRAALQFANRFYGICKTCYYPQGINGKEIHESKSDPLVVSVDRTSWLDLSLSRFKNRTITLPYNISFEYREHLKNIVRIYEKDRDGNPTGRWENGSKDDHFAHARNYSEIALALATTIVRPSNIVSPV